MDLHLKQCRNQHESDHQQPPPSANIPKLHFHHHHHQHPSPLPLLVPHHHCKSSSNNLPPVPHSSSTFPSRMGSFFSLSQWQELELQALIFRYMLAGAAVPPQLLQSIENSTILHSPSYFLHHPLRHFSHYQPPLLQSGYWVRAAMDPEPGRCRRTDGKKWRCSRDVVAGQKYCERHVHRGRNRSRKPVEMLKSSGACTTIINNNTLVGAADGVVDVGCGGLKPTSLIPNSPLELAGDRANSLLLSGHSPPVDLLRLNYSSSDSNNVHKGLFEAQNEVNNRSDGQMLRHFFDDRPRSLQQPDNHAESPMSSATCLSISMPGNSSSDVSLKLSTGNGDQLNWAAGWASNQVASMGGPLAEALRSSMSNSQP
ncbi:growth-regulating factor 3 isoform X1 [Gossypium raimondii]|uniref:growth-regulating factor 3 isoform X1 n=1 Tax=Gossypium raimondii TaxID=29730 RepID=UPI00227A62D5|nr:growth-regulating factor 3 isoform X1 [Gossypium raimondii]